MEDSIVNNYKFICTQCGCCCRNVQRWIDSIPILAELLDIPSIEFPYKHDNGVCEKLSKDNTCTIYNQRPMLCRTFEIFKILQKKYNISIETFLLLQKESCDINRTKCNSKSTR